MSSFFDICLFHNAPSEIAEYYTIKQKTPKPGLFKIGARGGTRTRKDLSTCTSSMRVCQFHHPSRWKTRHILSYSLVIHKGVFLFFYTPPVTLFVLQFEQNKNRQMIRQFVIGDYLRRCKYLKALGHDVIQCTVSPLCRRMRAALVGRK